MTAGEAVVELGLSGSPDAPTVRAAYLRLLKIRKPDIDPEGFRRLRQAYELIKDGAHGRLNDVPLNAPPELETIEAVAEARAWLRDELEQIGSAGFMALDRLYAIDEVHRRFPSDVEVALRLFNTMRELSFEAELRAALDTWLRQFGNDEASAPVWSWVLEHYPEVFNAYRIKNAPSGLPLRDRLRLILILATDHREPVRAADMLRELVSTATAADLATERDTVLRTVLEILHSGVLVEPEAFAALLMQRMPCDEFRAVGEWSALSKKLGKAVASQLVWAWLRRGTRDVREDYVLSADQLSAVNQALDTTRFLAKQLEGIRPSASTRVEPSVEQVDWMAGLNWTGGFSLDQRARRRRSLFRALLVFWILCVISPFAALLLLACIALLSP